MKLFILLALFGLTAAGGVFQHKIFKTKSPETEGSLYGGYLASIDIGTPPQSFLISLDTGSSDFIIPDLKCITSKCPSDCADEWYCAALCEASCCDANITTSFEGGACAGKNLFDSTNSSTYGENGKNWTIQFGTGVSRGFHGEDVVVLGGLSIPKCTVKQATELADQIATSDYDGILGLSLSALEEGKPLPVLYAAEQQGLLEKPIFSVYLNQNDSEGLITYGGLDTTNCSPDVDYVNVVSDIWYQFQLDSYSFGAITSSDKWQVITDLGTNTIKVPLDIAAKIFQAVNTTEKREIDCNASFDDFKLTINAKEYTIPAKQLILHEDGTDKCSFGIEGTDIENPSWILGDPFIRSYCNVYGFKDKTIGFAKVIA